MAAAVLAWGRDEAGSLGRTQLPRECLGCGAGEGVHCNKELNLEVAEPRFKSMPFCLQSPGRVPSKVAGCEGHTSSLPHLKSADLQEMKQPEEQDGR